jgi:hypothetical protein
MTIAAKISSAELNTQVVNRFVDNIFEARLINLPGTSYTPGTTNDTTFLSSEVTYGVGGYVRQTFKYISGDVAGYVDDGVGLARKGAVFTHDGSGTSLTFSHVALCRGNGNVLTLGAVTTKPSAGVNGTYTNLPTTTAGSGKGLTVNLTVTNLGASTGDWAVTVNQPGYGYAASDTINIAQAALDQSGATVTASSNLIFSVATVTTGGGQLVSVAQTESTINLGNGNQAVFYFDLKQFGYYTV